MKKLVILIPIYNESLIIKDLVNELETAIAPLLINYNIHYLFINDGSIDQSKMILQDLSIKNPRINFIEFSRNFGKEIAISAGVHQLDESVDAAIIMDADLQHPPRLIPEFVSRWEQGNKVVCGIRKSTQKKDYLRQLGSIVFYKLINLLIEFKMLPGSTDFRLIDKVIIKEFKRFTEHHRMFRGIIDWIGHPASYIEFDASQRLVGSPRYSLIKLVNLAINGLTSFSLIPLRLTIFLGCLLFFFSSLTLVAMVLGHIVLRLTYITPVAYFVVLNTLGMGIMLNCLGIISIYIGHTYIETNNRPLYVIAYRNGTLFN